MKIDVEGMEESVLAGATETISKFTPILFVENLKSNTVNLERYFVKYGYKIYNVGMNALAIHAEDPTINHLTAQGDSLNFTP